MKLLNASLIASVSAIAMAGSASAEGTIAYFASASQNGYNQATFEGVEEAAEAAGYTAEIFDGQFDAALQYSQIEDALASGKYVGMLVAPNDSVGVMGAFEQVIADGVPIGSVLFPIGPDLDSLEPQVEGITVQAFPPPSSGAALQAQDAAAQCEGIDPCNVVLMIGGKVFPFDNLRLGVYEAELAKYDNINVVAVGEGWYSPDASLTAMTDILQANPDVNVVLSNADQHLIGVEIALEAAGIDVPSVYMSGGGAAAIGVEAIREGRWDMTLAHFPKTMGVVAAEQIINAIEGKPVTQFIDMDQGGPVPAMVDAAVLEANPDFVGEWEQ